MYRMEISIKRPSPKMLGKLRQGHPIKMQPDIDGTGIVLVMHPEKYDAMIHTFRSGKAVKMALHPEEIAGSGLGGSAFKSGISGIKKVAELVPKSTREALTNKINRSLGAGLYDKQHDTSGQTLGALHKANLALFHAGQANSLLASEQALARGQHIHPNGHGIRTHRHGLHEVSSVGVHGNLIGGALPPALVSQPYSQHFQWGSRLPVAYQHLHTTGSGLYA